MCCVLQSILPEQGHFEHSNLWTAILAHVPEEGKAIKDKLHHNWSNPGKEQTQIDSNGEINVARWNQLVSELDKASLAKHPSGIPGLNDVLAYSFC